MHHEKIETVGDFEFGIMELPDPTLTQYRALVSNDSLRWNYWLGATEDSPAEARATLQHFIDKGFYFYGIEYEGKENLPEGAQSL
jgi:hypothetical protein